MCDDAYLGNRNPTKNDDDYENLVLIENAAKWAIEKINKKIISSVECTRMVHKLKREK